MLQLLVVTEGVTPFLYACWDDCMDYFILWNGRWYDEWYDEAWNNALLCITEPMGCFKSFLVDPEAEANLLSKRTWICRASPAEELQANFELNCTFWWQSTCSGSVSEEMVFLPHPLSGRRGNRKFPYRKGEWPSAPSTALPLWGQYVGQLCPPAPAAVQQWEWALLSALSHTGLADSTCNQ